MKVAICGYPPLAAEMIDELNKKNIECTHFIKDFVSDRNEREFNLSDCFPAQKLVTFFEFRKLINSREIDGVVIAEMGGKPFTHKVVKTCKLYYIPNVSVVNLGHPNENFFRLTNENAYIPYLEANLLDSCNLNCKACTHYSSLFDEQDFYRMEDFQRDMKRLADCADILKLKLLGGEPFKLKNLDEYLKIARSFLKNTDLRITTNGLLIPEAPQYVLDALRENSIKINLSLYPPTLKILDKIKSIFDKNEIFYDTELIKIENFNAFLTLHGGHNHIESANTCGNTGVRFLRNGKIYKCPVDALSYKFVEHFGLKDFPKSTGVDIFDKNFSLQLEQLEEPVELCTWCNETARQFHWTPENNPKITDWLADPAEAENLLPK